MGKSSLQAEAMFMLIFSICLSLRYRLSISIYRQVVDSTRRKSSICHYLQPVEDNFSCA
jgi:hypothetical protein